MFELCIQSESKSIQRIWPHICDTINLNWQPQYKKEDLRSNVFWNIRNTFKILLNFLCKLQSNIKVGMFVQNSYICIKQGNNFLLNTYIFIHNDKIMKWSYSTERNIKAWILSKWISIKRKHSFNPIVRIILLHCDIMNYPYTGLNIFLVHKYLFN